MPSSFSPLLVSRPGLWAVSIRDSFVILLPLTFFGVLATLIGNFPIPAGRAWLNEQLGAGWDSATHGVLQATWGVFGLALAVVLAMVLSRRMPLADGVERPPAVWAGLSALVNFMLCVAGQGQATLGALGQGSIPLGIGIGLATPELLLMLAALKPMRRLAIGYDTDPAIYHATRLTLPIVLLGVLTGLAADAVSSAPSLRMPAGLASWTSLAIPWLDPDWLLTTVAVLINQGLWFVGVHGGKVLDHQAQAIFGPVGAAYDASLAWRPLIDNFVHIGGSGATLGLMFALFIGTREGPHRRLAHLSWIPSLFNINELLLFGLPLVLNPAFVLPFLLAPLALTLTTLAAVHGGLVQMHNVAVPWTTPPLLSGYLLTGSWAGVALQGVGLVLSTLIYLPFVRRSERLRTSQQAAAFRLASDQIVEAAHRHQPAIRRGDQIGVIARGLYADLGRSIGTPALTLVYQPKHDREGVAVGVEALLRWQHPRFGPVRADLAVTLAEEGGLIRRLGAWVLEEACAQKAQWNALGLSGVSMAINVSPLQLGDPQLPAMLSDCIRRHALAPGDIELEITESHFIPVSDVVDDNLARISALGVMLAMDDFGMGHSSLLHLRRFRVHAIKIDGSITRDVLTHPTCAEIVRTISSLGGSQQAEVVAEFVETVEQRDCLMALGCSVFQGYLHSPPLPPEACRAYLQAHAAGAGTCRPAAECRPDEATAVCRAV